MLLYSLGPLHPRRRGDLDVQAGRRVHHPRRAPRPRSASTPRAGSSRSRAATTGIDFDIELAKKQSADNPVYYVQYAHARIASILRKAADDRPRPGGRRRGPLAGAPEAALARVVVRFPEVVEDAAAAEETHGVTAYATELATPFHAFYRDARVVDPAEPDRSARAARPRRGDPDHARQRARPAGDLGARRRCSAPALEPARGQPARPRAPASRSSDVVSERDDDPALVAARRRAGRSTRQPARGRAGGRSNAAASAGGVPGGLDRRRDHGAVRPSSSDPVAAPAGGRRGRGGRIEPADGLRSQIRSRNSPNVSWSPTVQPAPSRVARSAGSVHGDRRLVRRVLLGMEDLLGRVGRVGRRPRSTASQPPFLWRPCTNVRPVVYGNRSWSRRTAGIFARAAVCAGDRCRLREVSAGARPASGRSTPTGS